MGFEDLEQCVKYLDELMVFGTLSLLLTAVDGLFIIIIFVFGSVAQFSLDGVWRSYELTRS